MLSFRDGKCFKTGRWSLFFLLIGVSLTTSCVKKKTEADPNVLSLDSIEKIRSLDPIYALDIYSGLQSSQSYESLFQYHYLKRPYVLIPNLAEAMPSVSPDGLTLTIRLKKGVLFQDDPCFKETQGRGRELVAQDVVYSLMRISDASNLSPGWFGLDGRIIGLDEWRKAEVKDGKPDYSAVIEGLKSLDRYTIQIKLKHRANQLYYFLAMPVTGIVPREAVEMYGKEFLNRAVGTGPFKLVEYSPNSKIVWERNPTFRTEVYPSEGAAGDRELGLLADSGKQIPFVSRMSFQIYVERQPMWLNFLTGKLDIANIPKDSFSAAVSPSKELLPNLSSKGIKLHKAASLDVTHTSFNMADPIFGKNKLLRQALSLAYDEISYIDLFYNGRAIPAQGPVPPGLQGYDPDFKNPYRQFNLTKAKELLAKAGYPDGKGLPPIEYLALADSASRQSTEYVQKMFSELGVKLKISLYSFPQFQEALKAGKGHMWSFAWNADYPDSEDFLQLFYSKNHTPGPNDSLYSNPEYDAYYEKSLLLAEGPERAALYKKMIALVVEDCPWIFNVHRVSFSLTQPWIKNYKPNQMEPSRFKYYRVDRNLSKQ